MKKFLDLIGNNSTYTIIALVVLLFALIGLVVYLLVNYRKKHLTQ